MLPPPSPDQTAFPNLSPMLATSIATVVDKMTIQIKEQFDKMKLEASPRKDEMQ